jgi:hypothetical protein
VFEAALLALMRTHPGYQETDLPRLIRCPDSVLNDEAQWVKLIAVQAGIEMLQRQKAEHI